MANSGVRLNPNAAPLSADPQVLIMEWNRLDTILADLNNKIKQSNQLIEMGNKTIQECQSQGREVLGQLDILARLFNGMGIDPENYKGNSEKISGENPAFSGPQEVEEPVNAETKEDTSDKKFNINKFTPRPSKN